jgi:hypothetical protein
MTEYQVTFGTAEFVFMGVVRGGYTIIVFKAENAERQKPGIEPISEDKGHDRGQQQKQRIHDPFPLLDAMPMIIPVSSLSPRIIFWMLKALITILHGRRISTRCDGHKGIRIAITD